MTRMRCWAFTPDDRFAFGVTAPWWSHKRPINWGMPANDNYGTTQWEYPRLELEGYGPVGFYPVADAFDFTPTGGKRG